LIGNDAVNVSAATKKQATIEELLEAAFSVRSAPRLYGQGQQQFSRQSVSQSVKQSDGGFTTPRVVRNGEGQQQFTRRTDEASQS
jgi:hypothetical protein